MDLDTGGDGAFPEADSPLHLLLMERGQGVRCSDTPDFSQMGSGPTSESTVRLDTVRALTPLLSSTAHTSTLTASGRDGCPAGTEIRASLRHFGCETACRAHSRPGPLSATGARGHRGALRA